MPDELRRRVLAEAGYRCAVPACNALTMAVAHIVPYREVKEHTFANLIALCPNHHTEYDHEKIHRQSMHDYKERLRRINDGLAERHIGDKYVRTLLLVEESVTSATHSEVTTTVTLRSLTDGVDMTDHFTIVDEDTDSLEVRPTEFKFLCVAAPLGTTARYVVRLNRRDHFRFSVVFDPPLLRDEVITYQYVMNRHTAKALLREDLDRRLREGTYNYERAIVPAVEFGIQYPTEEAIFATALPEGYDIDPREVFIDVRDVAHRQQDRDEATRVKRYGELRVWAEDGRWRIHFHVPQPRVGFGYFVFFTPPSSAVETELHRGSG